MRVMNGRVFVQCRPAQLLRSFHQPSVPLHSIGGKGSRLFAQGHDEEVLRREVESWIGNQFLEARVREEWQIKGSGQGSADVFYRQWREWCRRAAKRPTGLRNAEDWRSDGIQAHWYAATWYSDILQGGGEINLIGA